MKTKLTLSIDRNKVMKLRRASARKGTSISELVEGMADRLDEEVATDTTSTIERFFGSLKLKDADFEEDSRGGEELRKTEYYEQMKKARRKG
jgi:hypothetical protein